MFSILNFIRGIWPEVQSADAVLHEAHTSSKSIPVWVGQDMEDETTEAGRRETGVLQFIIEEEVDACVTGWEVMGRELPFYILFFMLT